MEESSSDAVVVCAKTLAGDLYVYPLTSVPTAQALKERIAVDHDLAAEWLHLLDMEEEEEKEEDKDKDKNKNKNKELYADTPLRPTMYGLYIDPPDERRAVLHDWIRPLAHEVLNPHLLLENPSYVLTPREARSLAPVQLDYLAMTTPNVSVLRPHLAALSDNGWRRLVMNPAAVPLLQDIYENQPEWHTMFTANAPILAMNRHPNTADLLLRLLDDITIGTLPPFRRYDLFWRNVARYQPDAIYRLLNHPIGPGILSHLDHLCENPHAVTFFFPLPLGLSIADPRIRWNDLAIHYDAAPALLSLLPRLLCDKNVPAPLLTFSALCRNPHPCLLSFYRTLPPHQIIPWLNLLARHEDSAYVAFVAEYIPYLVEWDSVYETPLHVTVGVWDALNRNPSPLAFDLLRRYPEHIHWSLLTTNRSPEVIPMVEAYLLSFEEAGFAPFVSDNMASLMGYHLLFNGHQETYRGYTLWSPIYRTTLNLGALSLHPAALPLLQKRPELIYANSFSVRPDIYRTYKMETKN